LPVTLSVTEFKEKRLVGTVKTSVRELFFLLDDVTTMATHLESVGANKEGVHISKEANALIAARPVFHTAMNRIADEFNALSKNDSSGNAYISPARQAWENKVAGEMIVLLKQVQPYVNTIAVKDPGVNIEAEQGYYGRLTSLSMKNYVKDVLASEQQGIGRDRGTYNYRPFGNYKPKVVPATTAPVAAVVAEEKKAAPAQMAIAPAAAEAKQVAPALKVQVQEAKVLSFEQHAITGLRQMDYGLEKPVSYIHATINHPGSAISTLQEDAYPTAVGRKTMMDIQTQMKVNENKEAAVKQALTASNIKCRHKEGSSVISAEATADSVAKALGKKGLLPASLASEIANAADAAHPGQKQIAAQISDATAAFIAGIGNGGTFLWSP